jgi:ribosomal protein S27AE
LTGKERHDETHVCDEELVKTAELIRKTSKPCPTCGERIIKATGCDQMWCVKCHTAFSWRTGQIDRGTIHNPHFNQYQREVNNGLVVRNPGDIVCGGLNNDWWRVRNQLRIILVQRMSTAENLMQEKVCCCSRENDESEKGSTERKYHKRMIEKFSELYQFMRHINGYELPNYRTQVRELHNNEDIRIKYLLKEYSKEELAKEAIKRDKKRRKITEIMHIYELIVAVGNDLVNHLCDFVTNVKSDTSTNPTSWIICDELTKKFKEYDNFIDYVNSQFKMISVTYSQKVMQIKKNTYSTTSEKFTRRDIETFV